MILQAHTEVFADIESFNGWVAETQKPLIRFCQQYLNCWAEAEDAAQEAFLRAWRKRDTFKGNSSLLTWQMAIARRVCLDRLRWFKRTFTVPLDEQRNLTAEPMFCEVNMDVQRTLETLSAEDRGILYLRVHEDLSFEEICCILNLSPAACRKRYERAKKRFKEVYIKEN